jgi:hypothetical protein
VDGRKALEVQVDPRTAPAVPPVSPKEEPFWPPAADRLPVWAALVAALLGPALLEACIALEPAPTNPDAGLPVVAVLLGYALVATWLGAAVTGLARRPAAFGWAAGGAALAVVSALACPATGHHTAVAGWWVAETALCLSALALSLGGLLRWARRPAAA